MGISCKYTFCDNSKKEITFRNNKYFVAGKALISAVVDIAEVTGKDGRQHWSIKRYSHSYELKDKATIELENLFNGNEDLGEFTIFYDLFSHQVISEMFSE